MVALKLPKAAVLGTPTPTPTPGGGIMWPAAAAAAAAWATPLAAKLETWTLEVASATAARPAMGTMR